MARPHFNQLRSITHPRPATQSRSAIASGMSKRPRRSSCFIVPLSPMGRSAISSIAPSMAAIVTTAAATNFHVSVRISRLRAMRSRSSGSSAAIGSATSKPASTTAFSRSSALTTPGI